MSVIIRDANGKEIKVAGLGGGSSANAVTVPGGAAITMGEGIGAGGYQFKFTPEGDEPDLTASDVGYDHAESGLAATTVQDAVDEVADKLAAGQVYSTEEVRIGTWMGKPMYKKCYVGVTPSDPNTSKSVISDGTTAAIEHCIDIGGFIKVETSANNKIDIAPNFYWHTSIPEDTQFISTFFANGSINMNVSLSYGNKQFEIWITYTKTTDTAEST